MKKFLFALSLTMAFLSVCYGQSDTRVKWFDKTIADKKINVSIRGGVVFNSFSKDILDIWTTDMSRAVSPGWSVGLQMDCPILKSLSFQLGVNYRLKGFKINNYTAEYKHEIKAKAQYIDIPILFAYKHDFSDLLGIELGVGPYVSIGVGKGSVKELVTYYKDPEAGSPVEGWINDKHRQSKTQSVDEYEFFGDDLDSSLGIKRLDVGLTFTAGVNVNRFYIGFRYDLGLKDVSDKYCWSEDVKFLTRAPSVIIGLNFWK